MSWDIADLDCSTLAGWTTTAETGGCTCSTQTYDSRSVFRLRSTGNSTATTAQRRYPSASITDTACTAEIVFNVTDYPTVDSVNTFSPYAFFITFNGTLYNYRIDFGYDGTNYFIKGGTDATARFLYMVNATPDTWHKLRLIVDSSSYSVWFDDELMFYKVATTRATVTAGNFFIGCFDWDSAETSTAYIDSIKLSSTADYPTTSKFNVSSAALAARFRQNGGTDNWGGGTSYSYQATDKVRMKGGSYVLGCPMVATGHAKASVVRIYDGSAVKALMKV